MRILFIGDIVGSPGREMLTKHLAEIVARERADIVIINGENSENRR
jgi:calcineurin-like phosphoesterase